MVEMRKFLTKKIQYCKLSFPFASEGQIETAMHHERYGIELIEDDIIIEFSFRPLQLKGKIPSKVCTAAVSF